MDRMVAEVVLREREDEVRKADQEIRARALECAVAMYVGYSHGDPTTLLNQAHNFEAYIRDGVT